MSDIGESPVCRLQLPDGTVPGNDREAAEGWHEAYMASHAEKERLIGYLAEIARRIPGLGYEGAGALARAALFTRDPLGVYIRGLSVSDGSPNGSRSEGA